MLGTKIYKEISTCKDYLHVHIAGDLGCQRITVNPYSYPVNYKGEYHYRSGSTKQILKGAALTEFLTAKTGRNWDDIPIERVTVKELDEESFNIFRSQALKSGRMDEKDLKMSNEQLVDSGNFIIEA